MIGQRKDFARGHRNELNGRGEGMDHGASKTPPWTDFRPPTGEDTWSYIYRGLCRLHSKSHSLLQRWLFLNVIQLSPVCETRR